MALIPGQQRSLDKLKAMRVHLSNELAELINDFGPELYEDFNQVRPCVFANIEVPMIGINTVENPCPIR